MAARNQASASNLANAPGNAPANDVQMLRQHVDSQIGALRTEMDGKIATVTASLAQAEADRTVAINNLTTELHGVRTTLPTSKTIWTAAGTIIVTLIGAAALAWAIFDTGGGFVGAFSENVLDNKQQQREVNGKLDRLLEAKQAKPPGVTEGAKNQ